MSISVLFSIGGDAGGTGSGSAVSVESSGSVATSGSHSPGILAQSIGGGGGNGGNSTIFAGAFNGDHSVNMAIGGDGGAGGNGGAVDVNSSGAIWTQGEHSAGILAQSVGGGGGTGGDAKIYSVNLDLWIPDSPDDLLDLSQKIDFTASLGGSGGAAGVGKTVNVVNSDTIFTEGAFSSGILAQSIGGGGGAGGHAHSYEIEAGDPISTFTSLFLEIEYDFILGGNAGGGGDAGHVTVTNSGDIHTMGAFATGINAQSVGGGGGTGGNVLTFKFNGVDAIGDIVDSLIDLGDMSMVLSGTGGSGGSGGNVTVTNNSNITTEGAFAHGIFAQSIGGGGGSAGMSETLDISSLVVGSSLGVRSRVPGSGVWFAGSLGGNGSGGTVTVSQTGDITTLGSEAHGIFAQSAGYGAGFVDGEVVFYGGGPVRVTVDGNIIADGNNSHGIFAQSTETNFALGGNISVNIQDGTIQGGSGAGAGVRIDRGFDNTLTNAGNISALSGMAILAGIGHESVNNRGVVTGSVDLGSGYNTFNNLSGGLFNSGPTVYLGAYMGAGGPLNNSGTLSPGGSGAVETTSLTGNMSQSGSGVFYVDLDLETEQTDLLTVSGTSNLNGLAEINLINKEFVKPRTHQTTIISSAGGATDSGLSLLTQPSAVIEYEILWPNATDVNLETTIDFSPSGKGLAKNHRAIGNAINRILTAGAPDSFIPFAVELLDLPDGDSLGRAYDQLSPESYDASTLATLDVTQQYTQTLVKRMHSVRTNLEETGTIPGAAQSEEYAAWVEGFGRWADHDADWGYTGFNYSIAGVGAGLDWLFDDGFLGGASFGQSKTNIDLDENKGSGDIRSYFGSVYASWFSERQYVDAAFSYGCESFDNKRRVEVGELTEIAESDHNGDLYSAYVEAGRNYDVQDYILQPFAALQYTYLDEDGYGESGAEGINLIVDDRHTSSLVSDLGLRFYLPFERTLDTCIPEVTVAWRHDFDVDDRQIRAAFDSAPGVGFTTEGDELSQDGLVVGCGVTLLNKKGVSVNVRYNGEVRGDYESHQLSGGIRIEF
jgi:uncharacterized protein with beta-barrel porin domain